VSQQTSDRSFDELARALANGSVSRRRALRLMGAALLGGTLASVVGIGEAAADRGGCKRNGKHCKRDNQCCSGDCSSSGTCVGGLGCVPLAIPCISDEQCCNGFCGGPKNGPFCCLVIGESCTADEQCCDRSCVPTDQSQTMFVCS
jgi:hypothetical protein